MHSEEMTEEQFDSVIDSIEGCLQLHARGRNQMLAQQSGVILNASSIVGLYGNFGQTNYAAASLQLSG